MLIIWPVLDLRNGVSWSNPSPFHRRPGAQSVEGLAGDRWLFTGQWSINWWKISIATFEYRITYWNQRHVNNTTGLRWRRKVPERKTCLGWSSLLRSRTGEYLATWQNWAAKGSTTNVIWGSRPWPLRNQKQSSSSNNQTRKSPEICIYINETIIHKGFSQRHWASNSETLISKKRGHLGWVGSSKHRSKVVRIPTFTQSLSKRYCRVPKPLTPKHPRLVAWHIPRIASLFCQGFCAGFFLNVSTKLLTAFRSNRDPDW